MTEARETDRPLAEIAEAAICFWATGDHVEYWSDEDKEAVEEIAAGLEGYVMAGMLKLGWREG